MWVCYIGEISESYWEIVTLQLYHRKLAWETSQIFGRRISGTCRKTVLNGN